MRKFDRSLIPAAPDLSFEQALWAQGLLHVAGGDEAGRGALAGPVAAAVVVLPPKSAIAQELHGVRDSKQMTPRQRQHWAYVIERLADDYAVGMATAQEIDLHGILPATCLAVQRALAALQQIPQHLLLDYLDYRESGPPRTLLVKGDARCLTIAAASVLAKTRRDAWMAAVEGEYPGYGFARHKGYGTSAHLQALKQLGPCPLHRRSFRPKAFGEAKD